MAQNSSEVVKTQIYTILGLVFLIIAIPFAIVGMKLYLDATSYADEQTEPNEIVISNITESGVTISWTTESETEGFIQYGTSADSLNLVANDIRDLGSEYISAYKQHVIDISNLSPTTTYYYRIMSNGEEVGDASSGSFSTFAVNDSVELPDTLKGSISKESAYALVYFFVSNGNEASAVRSTYTAENGTFTYDIANLRTADGTSLFSTDNAAIVTYINSPDLGKARKVHRVTQDPGTLTLDPNSELSFTTDIDVREELLEEEGEAELEEETETEEKTETEEEALVPGIALMNNIYSNAKVNENPTIPTSIFVSNVNDTSFQVNWITKEPTSGFVSYVINSSGQSINAVDIRDSSLEVQRYTHSVQISNGSLTAGDIIYFTIVSNKKAYGLNGSSTPYEFVVPEILDSPPSPQAINGTLDYLSSSRLSSTYRDFIIYGKVKNSQGAFSIYVSAVPAYNSNGWTLSVGQARDATLATTVDYSSIDLYVVGEYNSVASGQNNNVEEVTDIEISPGLSIDALRHKAGVTSLSKLSGTSTPGSTTNITIDDTSFSVVADSAGEWSIGLDSIAQGEHQIDLNSTAQVLGLTFTIDLSYLPVTAFEIGEEEGMTIIGLLLLLAGLIFVYYIRSAPIGNKTRD